MYKQKPKGATMSDDTKIANIPKMPSPFSYKSGISAAKEQAQSKIREIDPLTVKNKLGIVFDDSGSMSGKAIEDAKTAVRNFLQSCSPLETSVAVLPLNADGIKLMCDYNFITVFTQGIPCCGGTPLFGKIMELLDLPITRGILFSDGGPTDHFSEDSALNKAKQKEIPLDCIYLGNEGSEGYNTMKHIAEATGGIFIHFTETSSLSKNLKYLSPANRHLMLDAGNRDKIQKGGSL